MNAGATSRVPGGFTLVELLVVIAIAGLLVALVPPSISAVIPGARAKVAARELAVELADTRSRAVSLARTETLHVLAEGVESAPATGRTLKVPVEMTLTEQAPGARSSRSGSEPEAVTVTFFADGSSSGGSFLLGERGRGYRVELDWLTGRTRVERDNVDAP